MSADTSHPITIGSTLYRIIRLMDVGGSPVAAWLDGDAARVLAPATRYGLRHLDAAVRRLRHGTTVCCTPDNAQRRLCTFDADGTLLSALRWSANDTLEEAWVRGPDGSWLAIEPRAGARGPWGISDQLWLVRELRSSDGWRDGATPLSLFAALDWARIDRIPPLAEPARLPAGSGTVVLNLIAELAGDAGTSALRYDGPYPTESLFLALLESFRYDSQEQDPLAAFIAGRLTWTPAPHERRFTQGICVSLRERIEKVVDAGRAYYRPDWQGVARWAPRRVREERRGIFCSLWALGAPVEDHLLLAPDGALVATLPVPAMAATVAAMPAAVVRAIAAIAAVSSAPALASAIRRTARDWLFEWSPVDHDLVALEPRRAGVSWRLLDALAARLARASTQRERLALALAALVELAQLLGDGLRHAAQELVAAASEAEQAALLEVEADTDDSGRASDIARGVEALLVVVGSVNRVGNHPDVERDERGNGDR